MKRVRIKYPGAFHHAMNCGYESNDIFTGNKNKAQFLEFLEIARMKDVLNRSKKCFFKFCIIAEYISKHEKEKEK